MNETTTTRAREERIVTAAAALAKHAEEGPAALQSMTDEQLLVLSGKRPRPGLLTPWVDAHAAAEQDLELLLSSTARAMLAAGQVAPEATLAKLEEREPAGDPADLLPVPLVAGILGRRAYSQLRVTMTDIDTPARGALQQFADRDGTVMLEQVSENGIHHFSMCTIPTAVQMATPWLLGKPTAEVEDGGDPEAGEIVSGTYAQLCEDSSVSAVLRTADRRIAVIAEDRRVETTQLMWVLTAGEAHTVIQPTDGSTDPRGLETAAIEAVSIDLSGITAQLSEFLTAAS